MPVAASSRSALAATIAGFLPPISVIAGRAYGPSWKRRPSARPTSAEPVNTTPSIAPSASARPVSAPPWTSPTTPSGRPGGGERLADQRARQRRLLGRLDHDRVAGDERAGGHPGDERDGEVERPDHAEHAEGPQDARVRLLGRELPERDREAAVPLDLRAVRLDQVDGLLDLGDRLGAALAGLQRHRRRHLHVALADRRARAPQRRAALRDRRAAPARAGRRGRARRPPPPARRAPRARGSRPGPSGWGRAARTPGRRTTARRRSTWGSGSAGPLRAADSAASNAASASGVLAPLVYVSRVLTRMLLSPARCPATVGTAWQAARCTDPGAAPCDRLQPEVVAAAALLDPQPRRLAGRDQRAARVEAAAGRDARRVGRLAGEDLRRHPLALGHDRQQRARVRMARVRQQLLGRPLLDDPAEVHDRDPVGDVPREPEVVGDDEDRDAGLAHQPEHQREDLAAHRGVEAGDRLVRHEQPRLEHHRAGDHHALALAAGHLVRVAGAKKRSGGRRPGARERLGDPRLLVAGRLLDPQPLGHRLVDRLAHVERAGRVLEDHLHAAAVRRAARAGRSAAARRDSAPRRRRVARARGSCAPASSSRSPTRRRARAPRPRAARGRRRRRRGRSRPCGTPYCTCRSRSSSSGGGAVTGAAPPRTRRAGASGRRATARRRSVGHSSRTTGQRGWNGQPDGSARGSGGSPGRPDGLWRNAGSPITGNAAAERPRVRMRRRVEHLVRRALLDDPARVHHREPPARGGERRRGRA